MARLSRDFYAGDTVAAAQALLGKVLVRRLDGHLLAGRITETEAYVCLLYTSYSRGPTAPARPPRRR